MRPSFRYLIRIAATCTCSIAAAATHAADIDTINLLTPAEFRLLSEDLGALLSYKPLIPSEPLNLTGFDIGIAVTGTQLENRDIWRRAAGTQDVPSVLPLVGVRAHKGLPLNIDLGASYAVVPDSNVRVTSGELRWAVLPGSTLVPAVALRLGASSMSGVDQLEVRTVSYDVSISKGFAFLTPYAGIGRVNVKSTPSGAPLLQREDFGLAKVYAGLNIAFVPFALLIEADRTGDATSYGIKFGVRF